MKRDSNLELCRIISMIIIVLNHVVSLGGVLDAADLHANTFLSLFFFLGGKFGTNVFVIIGLYFLIDQKQFKSQRIMRIWMQTLFYSLFLNLFGMIVFSSHISLGMWVKSILPITGRSYWFASSYLILLLVLPVLNKVYEKLNVRLYQILTATLVFSVLPTLTFNGKLLGNSLAIRIIFKLLMFGPVWFSYLYFVVRYIKTHGKFLLRGGGMRRYIIIFACSYSFMFFVEVFMYGRGIEGNAFMLSNYSTIRDMSSFPCLIAAGAFFMIFKKITIRHSKVINFIAANTFGVYLLHNHTVSVPIFWRGIFDLNTISKTGWYLPYSLFLVSAIFVVSIAIECVRKRMEDAILGRKKSKEFFEKIDKIINCFYQEKIK